MAADPTTDRPSTAEPVTTETTSTRFPGLGFVPVVVALPVSLLVARLWGTSRARRR